MPLCLSVEEAEWQMSVMGAEPFDGRELELNEAQKLAIQTLARLAVTAVYAVTLPLVILQRSTGLNRFRALAILLPAAVFKSAGAIAKPVIPPCPYAPPGTPVSLDYVPPDMVVVLRCAHKPEAHCWDGIGKAPRLC